MPRPRKNQAEPMPEPEQVTVEEVTPEPMPEPEHQSTQQEADGTRYSIEDDEFAAFEALVDEMEAGPDPDPVEPKKIEFMPFEVWKEMAEQAFRVSGVAGGAALRVENGIETLIHAPSDPYWPDAAESLYWLCCKYKWLNWAVTPGNQTLAAVVAVGMFSANIGICAVEEVRAKRARNVTENRQPEPDNNKQPEPEQEGQP